MVMMQRIEDRMRVRMRVSEDEGEVDEKIYRVEYIKVNRIWWDRSVV